MSDTPTEGDSDMDELERRVADEERLDHVMSSENVPSGPQDIDIDPIVQQFGTDGGVINLAVKDFEHFFFVPTNEEASPDNSYFETLGHYWSGIKILPPKFDANGQEMESDVDDPDSMFAELYIPNDVGEGDNQLLLDYGARAITAIREIYFPSTRDVSQQKQQQPSASVSSPAPTSDNVKEDDKMMSLEQVQNVLQSIPKKEDEASKKKKLASLVFKMTDPNLPAKPETTLILSDPILPAIGGMSMLERRLTPSGWKMLKKTKYTLSIDQREELDKMSSLGSDKDEDILYSNLSPPLALALKQLINKNSEFHLPLLNMFDLLWTYQSSNDSEYAVKINTVQEAQSLLDKLFVICQDQVQTKLLLDYQLKLQIANILAGSTKDKFTHKAVLQKVQHNMDETGQPSFSGVTKTVKNLASVKKTLAKGGFQLGKRPGADLSLTATVPNKNPKLVQCSVRESASRYGGFTSSGVQGRGLGNRGRGNYNNNNNRSGGYGGGSQNYGGHVNRRGGGGQGGYNRDNQRGKGGGGRGGVQRGGRGRGPSRGGQ